MRALAVGGTSGIGFAMACRVAAEASSAAVTIAGRTKPQNIPYSNIDFRPLDASLMCQINQFADAYRSDILQSLNQKLDLLIMTQGVMTTAGRTETPEGVDRKMAIHYYGKQLLIREFLPVMQDDGKIIIVFDAWLGSPDKLHWDDLDLKSRYSLGNAAAHCQSMNDAMVQWFAAQQRQQQADGVSGARRHFVHAYPGGVSSGLWRELPWYLRAVGRVSMGLLGVSPATCANYLLEGIAENAPAREKEGLYWSNIDNKGRIIMKKAIWNDEQLKKIADHTWGLIDAASAVRPSSIV